jgi:hypothetical protein
MMTIPFPEAATAMAKPRAYRLVAIALLGAVALFLVAGAGRAFLASGLWDAVRDALH